MLISSRRSVQWSEQVPGVQQFVDFAFGVATLAVEAHPQAPEHQSLDAELGGPARYAAMAIELAQGLGRRVAQDMLRSGGAGWSGCGGRWWSRLQALEVAVAGGARQHVQQFLMPGRAGMGAVRFGQLLAE